MNMNVQTLELVIVMGIGWMLTAVSVFLAFLKVRNAVREYGAAKVTTHLLFVITNVMIVVVPIMFLGVLGPERIGAAARSFASKYLTVPAVCCLLGLLTPIFPTLSGISSTDHPPPETLILPSVDSSNDKINRPSSFVLFQSVGSPHQDYDLCKSYIEENTRRSVFEDDSILSSDKFESLLRHYTPSSKRLSLQTSQPRFQTIFNRYLSETIEVKPRPVKQLSRVKFDSLMSHFLERSGSLTF
eukprot:TRINITY_DN3333_c4_g1_i2.p1 TRINITY_DN3333_c4_g1~~TRINITY_DN3333_c4_g1_i2.p1  ORF type:complete len:243 (+),score=39.74 TRINITY_DN3333_c4_g1_i2:56-784(+)